MTKKVQQPREIQIEGAVEKQVVVRIQRGPNGEKELRIYFETKKSSNGACPLLQIPEGAI